jgi:hypothetical protein
MPRSKPEQLPLTVPVATLTLRTGQQMQFQDGVRGVIVSTRTGMYTASYGVVAWVQVEGETYQRAIMSNDTIRLIT